MGSSARAKVELAFIDERDYLVHVNLCLAIDMAMAARRQLAGRWPSGEARREGEIATIMGWRSVETRRLLRALAYLGSLVERPDGTWVMLEGGMA